MKIGRLKIDLAFVLLVLFVASLFFLLTFELWLPHHDGR